MFATLWRTARRKGVAAGLAAVVATAGIGVAVAAPSDAPASPETASAFAIGATERVGEIVDDTSPPQTQEIDVPAVQPVVEPPAVPENDSTTSTSSSARMSGVADSPPVASAVDVRQFLPEGEGSDRDRLEELLAGGVVGEDLAEGAGDIADEVIARIQACVGDVVGQFASGFDPGASAGAGQSFATSVVDDVLPCVAGLVEDALRCVGGLVEEIVSTVMGMDFDEIAGLAGVIVDELVDCVGGATSD